MLLKCGSNFVSVPNYWLFQHHSTKASSLQNCKKLPVSYNEFWILHFVHRYVLLFPSFSFCQSHMYSLQLLIENLPINKSSCQRTGQGQSLNHNNLEFERHQQTENPYHDIFINIQNHQFYQYKSKVCFAKLLAIRYESTQLKCYSLLTFFLFAVLCNHYQNQLENLRETLSSPTTYPRLQCPDSLSPQNI